MGVLAAADWGTLGVKSMAGEQEQAQYTQRSWIARWQQAARMGAARVGCRGATWRMAGLLCGLACVRCATPLQSPATGGRVWHEARSEHFVIQTDAGVEAAGELTAEYERLVAFFTTVAFRSNRQPAGLTRVVVFKDEADYRELAPRLSNGFFRNHGGAPYDPYPTIVMNGQAGNRDILRLFCHELTHRFVAFHFPQAPVWLHEGLATYFETLRIEDDKAIVGLISPHRVHLGKAERRTESQGWFALTSTGPKSLHSLPMSEQVRKLSNREFYSREISDGGEAATATQLNYVAAWAQIHPMMLGPDDLRARFMRYLNGLATGRADAWEQSFDANSERALEAEYRDLVTRSLTRSGELPAPPLPVSAQQVRAMAASEVHWLWAALRNWSSPEERLRASRDVEESIRLAPERPDGYLLRSVLFALEQKHAERRRDIELALSRDARDPNALGLKAALLLDEQTAKSASERNFSELDAVAKRLQSSAKNSQQWLTLARYESLRGRLDKALLCALRAARDSSCWTCYWAVGDLELARNRVERAARALRVAANLAGENAPPKLRQQLDQVLTRSECQNAPSAC